jgi:hypothetical protein
VDHADANEQLIVRGAIEIEEVHFRYAASSSRAASNTSPSRA